MKRLLVNPLVTDGGRRRRRRRSSLIITEIRRSARSMAAPCKARVL